MKPSNNKYAKFKCRACGKIWNTDQIYQDESSTAVRWTCGNRMCGAIVDEITPEAALFEEAMERSLKDNVDVWRRLADL